MMAFAAELRRSTTPMIPRRSELPGSIPRKLRRSVATLARVCASALPLLIAAGCATLSARGGQPNFTGTWVLDSTRSRLEVPSPDSTIFVIRHQAPTVRLFRTHARGGTVDTATVTLRTDSSEVHWELRGAQVTSRSWWEGRELVFWSALSRGDQRASQVVRYSLSDDQRTFTAIETVDAGSASHVNRWVFNRRR